MQCRACFQANCHNLVDMNSVASDRGKSLFDYFNDCTQLLANSMDKLPHVICSSCMLNLQVAYNFRQEAHKSDKEFKTLLAIQEEAKRAYSPSMQSEVSEIVEFTIEPLAGLEETMTGADTSIMPERPIPKPNIKEEITCGPYYDMIEYDACSVTNEDDCDNGEDCDSVEFKNEGYHKCDVCYAKYGTENELKDHIFEEHKTNIICEQCPKVYELPRELQIHHALVHGTESHKQCLWCKELVGRRSLSKHIKAKHSNAYRKYFPRIRRKTRHAEDDVYYCEYCSEKLSTILELANHIRKHTFECLLCSITFKKQGTYRAHLRRIHSRNLKGVKEQSIESELKCSLCSSKFVLNRTYRMHMKNVHNQKICLPTENDEEKLYECETCNKCFRSQPARSLHKRLKHPELSRGSANAKEKGDEDDKVIDFFDDWSLQFKCHLCTKKFKSERTYSVHMKNIHYECIFPTGDEEQLYQCEICCSFHKTNTALNMHKKRKHPEIEAIYSADSKNEQTEENTVNQHEFSECKFCHEEIPIEHKKNHERRHLYNFKVAKKFLCTFCPREFATKSSVRKHEKKFHISLKPDSKECPICQKKLDPKYLKTHIENVHTSERKFICDICGDTFKTYILLHSHKQLHLERHFSCTICEKKFIRAFDLKVHMRIHTGEEPFACHLCDRRFKIRVCLNYHLQRHAGIKRKCDVCGKEFNHVKQLKIHSYKHTGMPYKCSVCDYGCAQRDVKHLLRMHNMTMTDEEYRNMFKANTGRYPHVKSLEELQMEAENMEREHLSE